MMVIADCCTKEGRASSSCRVIKFMVTVTIDSAKLISTSWHKEYSIN